MTVILICAFTFTSYFSYNVTQEMISQKTKTETLPLISDNIYSEIQQELITPINGSSLMANDSFLINWVLDGENNETEINQYLKRIKEKYGYFSTFFVSDITHNYYYYDGILKQISPTDAHDVWYYRFRDSQVSYALDVDTDEATHGTLTIFINHRLVDQNGNFLGVTGVGLEMDSFGKMLDSYRTRFGPLTYMVDANGVIQVHPDLNLVEKVNIRDLEGLSGLSEDLLSKKTGTNIFEYRNQQGNIILSARYFPDFDWFLIVEQNQTQAMGTARESLVRNLGIGIGVTILVILLVTLTTNVFYSKLEKLAVNDELTGLYNRRKFSELFEREISIAERCNEPLSLLMIDLDRFKPVNDDYGHPIGDQLLKEIAGFMKQEIRDIDVISRWGGEEFVVLLHKTDMEQAYEVAERIRKAIQVTHFVADKGGISKTVSIGISDARSSDYDMERMISLADKAMYLAKQAGRNQTRVSPPQAA
ncbi:MAG: diguanylate cyclase [Anaerolineaceae bacterium]|nr:diguanylate cyclase [Anaerolineaceae bacterium]